MWEYCCIPRERIQRIALYLNSQKKSLSQIKAETGADYLLNGTLYDMRSYQPVCHLKADGVTCCAPSYQVSGYAWNSPEDFAMEILPSDKSNYIACTPLIVKGEGLHQPHYDSGQGGRRGRSAIGTKEDNIVLSCAADGADASTPEELRDALLDLGWDSAVMLDGGGSCQCDFAGRTVLSSRRVQNLIVIYLRKDVANTKKVMLDPGHDAENANGSPDGSYKEHEFALDMGTRIKAILEKAGVEVSMTRTDGSAVSLDERCEMANAIRDLDLYVSLHSNAADSSGKWSSARGWSAHIIAKGGNAEKAAKSILSRVAEAGVAVRSQPVVVSNFQVLRETEAPAVLIEHGFHTNEQDVALLQSSEYRKMLASAEAQGILNHLGVALSEKTEGAPEKAEDWAAEAWEKAYQLGILDGTRPGDSVTRQELSTVLERLSLLEKREGV